MHTKYYRIFVLVQNKEIFVSGDQITSPTAFTKSQEIVVARVPCNGRFGAYMRLSNKFKDEVSKPCSLKDSNIFPELASANDLIEFYQKLFAGNSSSNSSKSRSISSKNAFLSFTRTFRSEIL